MNAALFALVLLLLGIVSSGFWYLLNRVGTRLDGIDGRLSVVEQGIARTEVALESVNGQLSRLDAGISGLLDKIQDVTARLAFIEGGADHSS